MEPKESNDLRTTLEGYPLWVLRKYQRATLKSERAALDFIIERWAMLEDGAEAYGVTLNHFERERALDSVSPIDKHRRGALSKGGTAQ